MVAEVHGVDLPCVHRGRLDGKTVPITMARAITIIDDHPSLLDVSMALEDAGRAVLAADVPEHGSGQR